MAPASDRPLVLKGHSDTQKLTIKFSDKPAGGCLASAVYACKEKDAKFFAGKDLDCFKKSAPCISFERFSARFEGEEFTGAAGTCMVSNGFGSHKTECVLGTGAKEGSPTRQQLQDFADKLVELCNCSKATDVSVTAPFFDDAQSVRDFLVSFLSSSYNDDRFKSEKKGPMAIESLTVVTSLKETALLLEDAKALSSNVIMAKELVGAPCNFCNPSTFSQLCQGEAKRLGVEVKVFGFDECQKMGMGSFCAVAQGMRGSDKDSQFVHLSYTNGTPKKRIALVGKGVMHDTGGYNIKSFASGMHTMHTDMGGAACQFTTFRYLVQKKVKDVEIHCVLPMVENHVDTEAVLPGSIVTAMDGTTIDILNTDAEGRLILCDAMAYIQNVFADKPKCEEHMITAATLTGAQIVALGNGVAAFYATDDNFAKLVTESSSNSVDNAWRMPLPDKYKKYVKGTLSDIKNVVVCGESPGAGGSVGAAMFLNHFNKKEGLKYAHFDIAGVVAAGGKATGFGPRLMSDVLIKMLE